MKKSIRIAATACAAVFLAGAFTGCTFGGSDKEKDGDGENGSSSGGGGGTTVQNRFAGKTIEHEDTNREEYEDGRWREDYDYERITFTKDTATVYSEWRTTRSDSEEIRKEKREAEYTYVLESVNGKNVLHLTETNPTYYLDDKGEEKECSFDEYVSAEYNGISSATKELLRKVRNTYYIYYEFTDNNTVKWYDDYYVGDMTKSNARFYVNYNNASTREYVSVSFGQSRLRLEYEKPDTNGDWVDIEYWGIPQFTGNTFTADMYRVVGLRDEQGSWLGEQYTSVGKITGSYAISGTGSKCTGTVSFTKFPNDEMKNLFATSYQVQNYDDDDDDDPDYTEYTIK